MCRGKMRRSTLVKLCFSVCVSVVWAFLVAHFMTGGVGGKEL
jgi:hypothetical protein